MQSRSLHRWQHTESDSNRRTEGDSDHRPDHWHRTLETKCNAGDIAYSEADQHTDDSSNIAKNYGLQEKLRHDIFWFGAQ